jgi:glucose-1-phosphate cytidylyltransferase
MNASLKVVLFCGGLGLRMREGAADAPKPMTMIGDRPLLWHVMRYYAHFGHTDFVLCLGHGSAAVKAFFLNYDEAVSNDFTFRGRDRSLRLFSSDITDWTITFVDTGPEATIGERLMRVREQVQGEELFLANYADTLTDAPLPTMIDQFRAGSAVVSLLAVRPTSSHHLVDMDASGLVSMVSAARQRPVWENGGYFVMRPAVFDELRAGEDLVPHAVNRLAERAQVTAYPYSGFWRAVDTFKDRAEMEQLHARRRCPWMLWERDRLPPTPVAGSVAG